MRFSEITSIVNKNGIIKPDVVVTQVSPPDQDGTVQSGYFGQYLSGLYRQRENGNRRAEYEYAGHAWQEPDGRLRKLILP